MILKCSKFGFEILPHNTLQKIKKNPKSYNDFLNLRKIELEFKMVELLWIYYIKIIIKYTK